MKKKKGMKYYHLSLPPDLMEELKEYADKKGMTVASLVRSLLWNTLDLRDYVGEDGQLLKRNTETGQETVIFVNLHRS